MDGRARGRESTATAARFGGKAGARVLAAGREATGRGRLAVRAR